MCVLKIFVGFIIFAALATFVIIKGGSNLDMGGEKHGDEAIHAPAEALPGPASAPASESSADK
jgi:archaellin